MKKLRIMTVFGTRPEAIKMCPLVLEMRAVTAQHREMLDQVLELFAIKPDYDLNIMTSGQTLYDITVKALLGLKDVIAKAQPDLILVHGDTTTTFAGSLAAYYAQIQLGHVEAGLLLCPDPTGACGSRPAYRQQVFSLSGRDEPETDRFPGGFSFCAYHREPQ